MAVPRPAAVRVVHCHAMPARSSRQTPISAVPFLDGTEVASFPGSYVVTQIALNVDASVCRPFRVGPKGRDAGVRHEHELTHGGADPKAEASAGRQLRRRSRRSESAGRAAAVAGRPGRRNLRSRCSRVAISPSRCRRRPRRSRPVSCRSSRLGRHAAVMSSESPALRLRTWPAGPSCRTCRRWSWGPRR